jgi:hypothetical protein
LVLTTTTTQDENGYENTNARTDQPHCRRTSPHSFFFVPPTINCRRRRVVAKHP